jgi:hypothetical protein
MAADRKPGIENEGHLWLGVSLFPRNINIERRTEKYKNVDRWGVGKAAPANRALKGRPPRPKENFLLQNDTLFLGGKRPHTEREVAGGNRTSSLRADASSSWQLGNFLLRSGQGSHDRFKSRVRPA